MVKVGDTIRILNKDGQYTKWVKKRWIVEDVESEDDKPHSPGYDRGIGGNLISCKGLPVSLYDWEFIVVRSKNEK